MEFFSRSSLSLILTLIFWSTVIHCSLKLESKWTNVPHHLLSSHENGIFLKETTNHHHEQRRSLHLNDHELIYTPNNNNRNKRSESTSTNIHITIPHMNQTFIAFGEAMRGLTDTLDKSIQIQNRTRQGDGSKLSISVHHMDTNHQKLIQQSLQMGELGWLNRQRSIQSLWINNDGAADPKSTSGTAYAFSAPNLQSMALANTSVLLEYASLAFMKGFHEKKNIHLDETNIPPRIKRDTTHFFEEDNMITSSTSMMERIDISPFVRENPSGSTCNIQEDNIPCDVSYPYRTYSGWCNNLNNPTWGKSVTIFDRMISPAYGDGISLPKSQSVTGKPLPSPRYISQIVHIDVSHLSQRHTLMFMQYGQFIDHDITFTPINKGPGNTILNCKNCESTRDIHPECWPIPVPNGDGWYPNQNPETGKTYCIPFTRSLPGQQRLGPREQINQNSAYLDSSHVYGENVCKMMTVRGTRGLLNTTAHPTLGGKPLLPQVTGMRECKSPSGFCFHAGDPRPSEQPALTAVHTIYLREHNRIADELHKINPHWNDEKIYQQSKKILSGQSQHITYSEFLPKLLGSTLVHAYGLSLNNEGYYLSYDPNCKAGIYNEFATAAFRFGHSLIRPNLPRMDNRYIGMQPSLPLRDGFFNSDMIYQPLMVDEILRGLLAEPMEQLDPFITNEIRNHLFEDKKKSFSGLDLISLNLQRGRDHGLQGYNAYRVACNLRKVNNFHELSSEIPGDVINRLQQAYLHVDDIDLFTGSLVEKPVSGGIVGPTMACIIGNQFKRLRQCDRFWYETNDGLLQFTPQQLSEIRKATLSKLICTNFDMASDIQKVAFDAPHKILNPRIPCDRLPTINLEAWRERPGQNYIKPVPVPSSHTRCHIGGRQIGIGESSLSSPCVSCTCTPGGTKCTSMKITNCNSLLKESLHQDILRDEICMAQCGYMLSTLSSSVLQGGGPNPNNVFNIINGRNRLYR